MTFLEKALDEALREFAGAGHDGDIIVEAIGEELKQNPILRRSLMDDLRRLIIIALPRASEIEIMERGLSCTEPLSQESLQHLVYAPAPEPVETRSNVVPSEHYEAILGVLTAGKNPHMSMV